MCRSKNFECWLRRISLVGACVFLGNGNVGRSQQIEELSQPPLAAEAAAEVSQLPDVPLVGESPFGILESEDDEAGVQTLTRGPLHEAFAEPLIWDPRPGLIVPNAPPPEINEVAPDFTPDGDDAIWISGYWGWDEQSEDFIWISGVYRVPPDEHRWVPGYWHQVDTGWQWVQGLWVLESSESIEYLPLPPASLENGPSSPSPPGNESFYIPGYWSQATQGYAWNAGYWHPLQSDFIWTPSHYVWSPRGCVFVSGYWDRRLPLRGFCFAPAAIQYATYSRPGWSWRPRVVLNSQVVLHNLFVQPGYNHYLFGDYYAPRRIQHRVLPAYLYHQQRGGFDPLISWKCAAWEQLMASAR